MPITLFWMIVALFFHSPNSVPAIENLVSTLNPAIHQEATVDDIHFSSIVIDSHVDTMMHVINEETWLPEIDIGEETSLHIDIPKMNEGGLNAAFFAAYTTDYYGNNARNVSRTLALINALHWTEKNNPDEIQISSTTHEILNTVHQGKIAAIPTIEGGYSLEEHNAIELLHQYHDLGVKAIGFNWNYSNALGEGANRVYGDPEKTPSQGGLTDLGAAVSKEMNKLGMIIDVSHMSENTFWDVMEVTEAPVMATHSAVNKLKNHQRNLTDEQLRALAENGGVIGIVFYPLFLTDEPEAYVTDVVDHIDYAVNLIGINHVAIGSDFDGSDMPIDINDATDLHKITDELVHRGYTNGDIQKLLGNNTLRLLNDVEEAAEILPDSSRDWEHIKINPSFEMGEIIDSSTPLLTADIDAEADLKIEDSSFRVIVDGIAYDADYDSEASTISKQLSEPLQEKYHVVTFEASMDDNETIRETRIFYINGN
ncbi:dipeptidase [Oceanobacillus saliphilus]|uniref:dipeptidase n=1 Tax=Oceanobacillus saliphilus TaxID=2925834 RepID=UPI00201DBFC2|nr:dipeptidase [Oceanobacillus saliphilus]